MARAVAERARRARRFMVGGLDDCRFGRGMEMCEVGGGCIAGWKGDEKSVMSPWLGLRGGFYRRRVYLDTYANFGVSLDVLLFGLKLHK